MKHLFLLFIASSFLSLTAKSQSTSPQVISTSGTSFSNASGQLDWTLGEPVTSTLNSSGNELTQGFHQPELLITTIEEKSPAGTVSIFPNPTVSTVEIQFSSLKENTVLELYTIEGKLLQSQKVEQLSAQINMEKYSSGTYFLKVTDNTNKPNTYKISKSK